MLEHAAVAIPLLTPEGQGRSDGQPLAPQRSGEALHIGTTTADQALALAEETKAHLDLLQARFDAHTHPFVGVASGSPGVTLVTTTTVGPLGPIATSRVRVDG